MDLTGNRRQGNTMLEFTLVGIPLIFVLISVFEVARGMWIYDTLAYAVKEGTRYAILHGENCNVSPNACNITVGDVVGKIRDSGVGLLPSELNVTLLTASGVQTACNPISTSCLTSTTRWPPSLAGDDQVGKLITIRATYQFNSALAMFWPGAGNGVRFGAVNLPASSTAAIRF
jgi:hypothetical protein